MLSVFSIFNNVDVVYNGNLTEVPPRNSSVLLKEIIIETGSFIPSQDILVQGVVYGF